MFFRNSKRLTRSLFGSFRAFSAQFLAKTAARVSRLSGRGGGTALPGLVLLHLDPDALSRLSGAHRYGSVLCSATNGKTTTTNLIDICARSLGLKTLTNASGSNLERGIAAALLSNRGRKDLAVLEVDEAALVNCVDRLHSEVVVLMNLFTDQTDRFGSLDNVIDMWAGMIRDLRTLEEGKRPVLVVNADDPNLVMAVGDYPDVFWFGFATPNDKPGDNPSDNPTGFSAADGSEISTASRFAEPAPAANPVQLSPSADIAVCDRCGADIKHHSVHIGHIGSWYCPTDNCETRRPPLDMAVTHFADTPTPKMPTSDKAQVVGSGIELGLRYRHSSEKSGEDNFGFTEVQTRLTGIHNGYNSVAALSAVQALCKRHQLDFDIETLKESLKDVKPVFGRGEVVSIGDIRVEIMLVKNATGADLNLKTISTKHSAGGAQSNLHLLFALNNRIADGRDISWLKRVDFSVIAESNTVITLAGDCVSELETRLLDVGFDRDRIAISDRLDTALDLALDRCFLDEGKHLWIMPSYTAMLELQAVLNERGLTNKFWEESD